MRTDEMLKVQEMHDEMRAEIERLRAAMLIARSLMHNLPRSASADKADKVLSDALEPTPGR